MTNIAEMVREAAASRPKHAALVAGDRRINWSDLDKHVDTAARALIARGLAQGERVGLMAGNTPAFVISYFGILRAGLVAMPLNPGYTGAEVSAIASLSGARLVLADRSAMPAARAAAKKVPGLDVVDLSSDEASPYTGEAPPSRSSKALPSVDDEELAVLLFTSGSEGTPKGVMLTHKSLRANIDALTKVRKNLSITSDDVVLMSLPLFHVYGLNAGLGLSARVGATTVLLERWDARRSLAVIAEEGVTTVAGAPPMYIGWSVEPGLREALSGVRLLVSGGSALPAEVFAQFKTLSGKTIWEGYGMTEAGPVIATAVASGKAKPGCVGKPLKGVSITLRDTAGREVEEGDAGEVWVKGASLFTGYWPGENDGRDGEGWFHTGDVAYFDDAGDLHLVDRRKDLIIVSGFNVFPAEVEKAIALHDAVDEVAVVGVPHPLTGEAVKAFVTLKPESSATAETLRAHSETRLARFKCPSIIEIVAELPHVSTGKVSRAKLREAHA